ncbi:hypothetical protein C8J57DRAFT_1706059 [Mycena rebaudengoi]|nr:hypothetical protein C8J57DRAFT_1706059 [Mycena rebaudengoi]
MNRTLPMTTESEYPDLHNELHFPALNDLPKELSGISNRRYFRPDNGSFAIHWCFLAQIKNQAPYPARPMYKVVDREGVECLVTFNIADRSQFPRIYAECKDGYTMCIMYATYHHFADGQNGIRVEVANTVKVVPCGLQKLFEIGDRMKKNQGCCAVCRKNTTLKCSRCRLCYCSKDCQAKDWGNHKKECKDAQQVVEWAGFDWNQFDRFRLFGA